MAFTIEQRIRWHRIKYFIRRRVAIVYLGGKCIECGYSDDGYGTQSYLEVDHIDPTKKQKQRSRDFGRVRNCSPEKFWAEIEQCQLLCRECHEEKTAIENQSLSYQEEADAPF